MNMEKKPLSLIVSGEKVGPFEVPVGMPMVDFLHHYLNLTGTRFGCGQGVCHACTVIEVQEDRSEERRVGKECRGGGGGEAEREKGKERRETGGSGERGRK